MCTRYSFWHRPNKRGERSSFIFLIENPYPKKIVNKTYVAKLDAKLEVLDRVSSSIKNCSYESVVSQLSKEYNQVEYNDVISNFKKAFNEIIKCRNSGSTNSTYIGLEEELRQYDVRKKLCKSSNVLFRYIRGRKIEYESLQRYLEKNDDSILDSSGFEYNVEYIMISYTKDQPKQSLNEVVVENRYGEEVRLPFNTFFRNFD